MAIFRSDKCETDDLQPAVTSSQAGVVLEAIGTAVVTDDLAKDDVIYLCKLPAGHQPVDFQLEATDLDTNAAPTITLSVGVLDAAGTGLVTNTHFLTDSDVAQAGGIVRADVLDGLGLLPATADRIIAIQITTVAATKAAGTIRGKLAYCENP